MTSTNKKIKLRVNGVRSDFTYSNELTPIEHTFIEGHFKQGNYDGMVDYIEDCVLWKRQNYFDPIQPKGFKKEGNSD